MLLRGRVQNWRTHLPSFERCPSKNVLNGDVIAGLTEWSSRGSTLKKTTLIRSYVLLWVNRFSPELFDCTTNTHTVTLSALHSTVHAQCSKSEVSPPPV
jgi:hypothetical protein